MKKLKNQIKESFFNPIFHFLPLLTFLVIEDYFGIGIAWMCSFPVALILLAYVYLVHIRIFYWHLFFTLFFVALTILSALELLLPIPSLLQPLIFKSIVLYFIVFVLIFRTQVEKVIFGIMSKLIPMSNNFNELYRVLWGLFFVLVLYISCFIFVQYTNIIHKNLYLQLLTNSYVVTIFLLVIFELLRVNIIRSHLIKEEWWPIVTEQGKIIGSIEHNTSLCDKKKYIHPLVRLFMIEKSMVFLQKNSADDLLFPGLWDTVISNHVRMGESIDQCAERTAVEKYGINNLKYIYLSTYLLESKNEKHYAFLFVSCQSSELNINPVADLQTKWWTQQQIEENLETGIFSDNFKVEFDLLKRSGLLETGRCECNCRLKDVIYQQTDATKQEE
ncbi:MAG: NUDIX domain-containing protein [Paludibacter sp.]